MRTERDRNMLTAAAGASKTEKFDTMSACVCVVEGGCSNNCWYVKLEESCATSECYNKFNAISNAVQRKFIESAIEAAVFSSIF